MDTSREYTKNCDSESRSVIPTYTIKSSASQCLATVVTNLIKFTSGSYLGITTVILGELYKRNAEIEMSLSELTSFGSSYFMMPIGALLMGPLAQSIGPRRCLLMSSLLYIISGVIFYFATNSAMLLCAQAIGGLIGPISLGPGGTYVAEIAEPRLRSVLMATANLSVIIGSLLSVLYSNWLHWRSIILINLITPILGFLFVNIIPESPHWLASKGKFDEAKIALSWLRGWTTPKQISAEFDCLKETYKIPDRNSANSRKSIFKHYLNRSFLLPLSSVCCMFILHSCTGYNTLTTYSMIIFQNVDSPIDNHIAASVFDGMRVIGAVVCIISVHYTRKRNLLFLSSIGAGLTHFIVATVLFLKTDSRYAFNEHTLSWIVAITLILTTFLTASGIDKIVFMYNVELFPTKFRNVGTGLGIFIHMLSGTALSKSFLYLEEVISLPGAFLIFGISCFVCCLTFYFILPETDGKTLQEIQDNYTKKSNSKPNHTIDT